MSGVKDCQCETNEIRTPESVANRPGRSQVEYRVGTHGSFLDTMTARLSNFPIEIPKRAPDGQLSLRPEIRDHRRFLGFLLNRSDPVACFLRRLLSFTAEELLDEHQAGTSEQELVEKVASELAKLLPQRRLTTDPQFNSALVTPAIHQLMCRGRLDPELRMRLNLLVLHVCLPSIFPDPVADRAYPLSRLTSRDPGDPAIALLDAWSTVSDVLTFYQERIANEGYLRTATERKSLFELAHLVGYRPRPGVAASGFVAFTLDNNLVRPDEVLKLTIPAGTACRSTAADGEQQQVFETSEAIEARSEWNDIRPRLRQPQRITIDEVSNVEVVYLEGIATGLSPNDELLFTFGENERERFPRTVASVAIDAETDRTEVRLQSEAFSLARFLNEARIRFSNYGSAVGGVSSASLQTISAANNTVEALNAQFTPATQLTVLDETISDELSPLVQPRDNEPAWVLNVITNALTSFGPSNTGTSLQVSVTDAVNAFRTHANAPTVETAARTYRRQQRLAGRFLDEIASWTFLQDAIDSRTRSQWRDLSSERLDRLREMLNTDPAVTLNSEPLRLVVGFHAAMIDPGITIADAGDAIKSAEVTITLFDLETSETPDTVDALNIAPDADTNNMNVVGATTQQLTISADSSSVTLPTARFQSVLRHVVYSNSAAASTQDRLLQVRVTDGDDNETRVFRVVQFVEHDLSDPQFDVHTNPAALSFREDSDSTTVDSGLLLSHPVAAVTFDEARIILSPDDGDGDMLTLPTQTSGITLGPPTTPGVFELQLPAAHTKDQVQAAMRAIRFSTATNPDLRSRTVTFELTVSGVTRRGSREIEIVDSFVLPSSPHLDELLLSFCDEFGRIVQKTGGTKPRYVNSLRTFVAYFPSLFERELPGDINLSDLVLGIITRLVTAFRRSDGPALSERADFLESALPELAVSLTQVTTNPVLLSKSADGLKGIITGEFDSHADNLIDYIDSGSGAPPLLTPVDSAIILLERVKEAIESLPPLTLKAIADASRLALLTGAEAAVDQLVDPTTGQLPASGDQLLRQAIVSSIPIDLVRPLPSSTSSGSLALGATAVENAIANVGRINSLIDAIRVLCDDMTKLVLQFRQGFIKRVHEIVENFAFIDALGGEASTAHTILQSLDAQLDQDKSLDDLVDLVKADTTGTISQIEALNATADVDELLQTIVGELSVAAALVERVIPVSTAPAEPPIPAGPGGLPPVDRLLSALRQRPSLSRLDLVSLLAAEFGSADDPDRLSDLFAQLLEELQGTDRELFYQAWRSIQYEPHRIPRVYAFRARANVFGRNAQRLITYDESKDPPRIKPINLWDEWPPAADESGGRHVFLDGAIESVVPGDFILLKRLNARASERAAASNAREAVPFTVDDVEIRPRTEYGLSSQTTRVAIGEGRAWWDPPRTDTDITAIRTTVFHVGSEQLALAGSPVLGAIGGEADLTPSSTDAESPNQIELNDLYDGLRVGQTVTISGERLDLPGTIGTEVAEIRRVEHIWRKIPGDTVHTRVTFSTDRLAFRYLRGSVSLNANVAPVTHGETQPDEILGSGDSSLAFQRFPLAQSPLTHVSATNASGTESTLEVRINNVRWHESDSFLNLQPDDRAFVTQTDETGLTTIYTGDGERGARIPTGVENVTATYRVGIGESGNVRAGQIDQPPIEPAGIREVINPEPTSGGTNPDNDEQIRANTPLAVIALDRLVSVQDYADFARKFAGIGKATSTILASPRGRVVFVTVTGTEPTAIQKNSNVILNLRRAFRQQGDPDQPVLLDVGERILLILSARIRVLPDYEFPDVEQRIKSRLIDMFSFSLRRLGQDAHSTEVISLIQSVPGVAFVDVDGFDSVPQTVTPTQLAMLHIQFSEGTPPKTVIPVNDAGLRQHDVLEGETLTEIAERFGDRTNLAQIYELNPLLAGIAADEKLSEKLSDLPRLTVSQTWPAQIAYFSPRIENTIVLQEIKS